MFKYSRCDKSKLEKTKMKKLPTVENKMRQFNTPGQ